MSADETIDIQQISQHADTMGQLASSVGAIVGAVAKPPNPTMYGVLMSPVLTGVMTMITTAGADYIKGATHAVSTTAEGLARTRDAYQKAEDDNVELARRATPA